MLMDDIDFEVTSRPLGHAYVSPPYVQGAYVSPPYVQGVPHADGRHRLRGVEHHPTYYRVPSSAHMNRTKYR